MKKGVQKILWFDTETTGTDTSKHGLIQLAAVLEVDGILVEEIELKIKPFKGQIVTRGAVEIHGFTMERLRTDEFLDPKEAYREWLKFLARHIDKYDRSDKAYVGGQNVHFDVDFLNAWFSNNHDTYLGSWINWRRLDSLNLAHVCASLGLLDVENFKLGTLCEHFGIPLDDAHDALADIRASRLVYYNVLKLLRGTDRLEMPETQATTAPEPESDGCPECNSTAWDGSECWLCGFVLDSQPAQ